MNSNLTKFTEPQKVGVAGFVRLVDVMGDDSSITQAARVSYGAGTKTINDDRSLIRYLMRHFHTTPLEMCELKIHIKAPIHVFRQMFRHRAASINEVSTRYSVVQDEFEYLESPEELRTQSTDNKQGSGASLFESSPGAATIIVNDFYNNSIETSFGAYNYMIEKGVAREQARNVLPLATYSEAYWKIDLHNLFHFLKLRLDSHAQLEIREFAQAIANIVQEWCPIAWEAFVDYRLEAAYFSKQEMGILKKTLGLLEEYTQMSLDDFMDLDTLSKREQTEFKSKL